MTTRNNRVRFLTNNFLAGDATTLTASGEMASFPVENVADPRRFKLWVPPGTFVVTSTNKTIYINDGSDKTVTLTEGTYTYATLATHIQTQLNASSTNWTCSYATTGANAFLFRFGRSSGTALLRLSQTTNAAWDMLGFVGTVDDDVGTGQNADEIRCHTYERLHVDLGTAREVLAFALFGRAGEVLRIPTTATVTLKASNTNNFDTPDLSLTLTPQTDAILRLLDDQADSTYRYWELKWIDRTNPAGPEAYFVAQVYLGDYVTPETRNVGLGFRPRLVDPSVVQESENGALSFRTFTKFWVLEDLVVQMVQDDDREALFDMYSEVGLTTPFVLVLDPMEEISANQTEWVKYGVLTAWEPEHVRYTRFTIAFSFREIV